jgi:hypothetical protein
LKSNSSFKNKLSDVLCITLFKKLGDVPLKRAENAKKPVNSSQNKTISPDFARLSSVPVVENQTAVYGHLPVVLYA